jgi:hypothetical protein
MLIDWSPRGCGEPGALASEFVDMASALHSRTNVLGSPETGEHYETPATN